MNPIDPPQPSTIEERLARAMRIHSFGMIRPLWEDLRPGERQIRTDYASKLIKLLKRHGIDVVMTERNEP